MADLQTSSSRNRRSSISSISGCAGKEVTSSSLVLSGLVWFSLLYSFTHFSALLNLIRLLGTAP